jgi:hypothetical protein
MRLRSSILFLFIFIFSISAYADNKKKGNAYIKKVNGLEQRKQLVDALILIANPVLESLSKDQLKKLMPVESAPGEEKGRREVTYLEAFGRLLAGMAPWLELGPDDSKEGKLRKKYIELALKGIHHATNPNSADYMNFNKGKQPLVDAAFLAQALLRAPNQLWKNLDSETQQNVIRELKSSRTITPYFSNWLLFSATVEAALEKFDKSGDMLRIDYAIKQHLQWYKGDGVYGDGPNYHADYYNSFVIQPMMLDVLMHINYDNRTLELTKKRASRYAETQERMISPEGTYPPIGRSLAYRFGAFQSLSQITLLKLLPKHVNPQQVRAAFYTMIKKQIAAPETFDKNGWLQIGFYGHQPNIGETYISTGSLYLCSMAFLVLGLPETDEIWTDVNDEWTQLKIWNGKPIQIDKSIDN